MVERPELRIVDETLWQRVQARRARIRAHYEQPRQFGKGRAEYGSYWLSGLLVCGECQGVLTIRTGSRHRGDHRYGCSRRWRRGPTACTNSLLVRRDVAEQKIAGLLQQRLYTPAAVQRLVEKVNARLRALAPAVAAERAKILPTVTRVQRQLERLRQFVLHGDTSAKVRAWLAEAEREEARLKADLARLDTEGQRRPIQLHPGRVQGYLEDLRGTLLKGGTNVRQLLHADIERIIVHPVRSETAKPFARAEVITTGKGLLDRVAFVVAGARTQTVKCAWKCAREGLETAQHRLPPANKRKKNPPASSRLASGSELASERPEAPCRGHHGGVEGAVKMAAVRLSHFGAMIQGRGQGSNAGGPRRAAGVGACHSFLTSVRSFRRPCSSKTSTRS